MRLNEYTLFFITILPILFVVVNFVCGAILPEIHNIECEYYDEKSCIDNGDCVVTVERCKNEFDKTYSCYVLWSFDQETQENRVKMKGCFTEMHECNQTECVNNGEPRQKNMHFCCCKTTMCNTEHKWIPVTTEATTQVPKEKTPSDAFDNYFLMSAIVLLLLMIGTSAAIIYYRKEKPAQFNEIASHEADISNSSPLLSNFPITLLGLKATGRFGDVYQGKQNNQDVAVKIFRMQEKDSWNTEIEIYKLPRMRHPNILEFITYEKRTIKMQTEYWLITNYHPNGSLCDYLKSNTLTWPELLKIALSMANGLMHLHEEIPASKTEGLKPSIAHRDFKSKNVLLKSDLTACIADFGLAMTFQPGKPCGDTHGQVGTRRYMAPEVLEGAINFNRDAFLRIDVYACGLVLWEIVSRCSVIGQPNEYQLPFEAELGQRPTLDAVQDNIVMKKLRPHIEDSWRRHRGLSIICDTMEECWDHDAEARLSSSCVMERFAQMNKYASIPLYIENNTNCNDEKDS